MSQLISINVHLHKFDRNKIVTGKEPIKNSDGTILLDKAGKPVYPKYINLTVAVNDQADQFGKDIAIWHEQTTDERKANTQRIFCGNGKLLFDSKNKLAPVTNDAPAPYKPATADDDGLGF